MDTYGALQASAMCVSLDAPAPPHWSARNGTLARLWAVILLGPRCSSCSSIHDAADTPAPIAMVLGAPFCLLTPSMIPSVFRGVPGLSYGPSATLALPLDRVLHCKDWPGNAMRPCCWIADETSLAAALESLICLEASQIVTFLLTNGWLFHVLPPLPLSI